MYEARLVDMPFAALFLPAIGLEQLKSILKSECGGRVNVEVLYLNHDFGHYLGKDRYESFSNSIDFHNSGVGEWFFRQAAFPELPDNTEEYFGRYYPYHNEQTERLKTFIQEKRRGLDEFLASLVRKYRLDEVDLVGFTSMFAQNVASLAMARRVKESNPQVITLMGGANCEAPMGHEIFRASDYIDYVFSGPALKSFPQFINYTLDEMPEKRHTINGVLSRQNYAAPIPQASLGQMKPLSVIGDELDIEAPIDLDYAPYLKAVEKNFPDKDIKPVLLFETSRGCWWGEKAHCTFCGLNGQTMNYRAMSPQRALEQFEKLFSYATDCSRFSCVDNIMPRSYLKEVFPLVRPPSNVTIFYEVKSDLTADDLQTIAKAGVRIIQPGIESLATSTLKLMKKGSSAFQNIDLLKNCLMYDIQPEWNLLIGFPGEDEDVYKKYLRDLPLLVHLPPPTGVFPVRFDRYSPYFVKAREYGLDLQPVDYYEMTYPLSKQSLTNLAYYFMDRNLTARYFLLMVRWIGKIREKYTQWQARWNDKDGSVAPHLFLKEDGDTTFVYDSRSGEGVEHRLSEVSIHVLKHLEKPRRALDLAKAFSHFPGFDVEKELAMLRERGLIFHENERFLSLVLAKEPPPQSAH
jgi:ribosomal peptide maturation radical SAM protein 1